MTVSSEFFLRLKASQSGAHDFGGPSFAPIVEFLAQMADGVDANEADVLFVDERSIAASTNDDLDLAGVLTNAFGAVITAAELVALIIINRAKDPLAAANVSDLTIGLGTNPFLGFLAGTTPTIGPLKPGAMLALCGPGAAGLGTIGAGASDILRIANGAGGTAKVQVAILARTA